MAQYLSKENKKRLSFSYFVIFALFIWYAYSTNKDLQNKIMQSQLNITISDYDLYNKLYEQNSKILKDILIENHNYIDTDDLVEEYSRTTPLMMDKKEKKIAKYVLTIKFLQKNKRHGIDIENKISTLKKEDYIYTFEDSFVELFGKVNDDGYIQIVRQFGNATDIKNTLDHSMLTLLIAGLINILIFLYILTLFDENEEKKKNMYDEYEKLSNEAQAIAMVDALTGAATRVKFNKDLDELLGLASRFKEQGFTFMILDIDNFKKVNDTYGHDYGDIVLKSVAKTVNQHIRKTDHFYRWGGEEFVILMPMNSVEKSVEYADILREKISKIKFEKLEQITCSFGLVEFEKGDDETTIIKRADELLYIAKKNGKNRVEYI